MAQRIAALPTGNLVGEGVAAVLVLLLYLLGQTVRVDRVLKCRPGSVVFVLLSAAHNNSQLTTAVLQYFTWKIMDTDTDCRHTSQN